MSVEDIVEKPVNDVASYVEKKEMARDANLVNVNSSAISGYRQESRRSTVDYDKSVSKPPGLGFSSFASRNEKAPCSLCGKQSQVFSEGPR